MNINNSQSLVFNGFRTAISIIIVVSISACVSHHKPITSSDKNSPKGRLRADLICRSADSYKGRVVGDGHCVSLIKRCSNAPLTSEWRPGAYVLNSQLPTGTVIATFRNGRYPNHTGHHAAIYIKQDQHGIWVWDQWVGKPVHKRLIRIRNDNASPGNTAQNYRVVHTE